MWRMYVPQNVCLAFNNEISMYNIFRKRNWITQKKEMYVCTNTYVARDLLQWVTTIEATL